MVAEERVEDPRAMLQNRVGKANQLLAYFWSVVIQLLHRFELLRGRHSVDELPNARERQPA